jgi:hypothetical protein
LQAEGMQLLEQALPQLIASDGSPAQDSLPDYVAWLHPLLADLDLAFLPRAQNALDRARPFLSMLVRSDGRYCFDPAIEPLKVIRATAALRHAPSSDVARLAAGKCVAIIVPGQQQDMAQLSLSAHGHFILNASLFLHGPGDDQSVKQLECDSNKQGQWFRQTTHHQQRTLFLCAKGDDLRVEDQIKTQSLPGWMRIDIAEHARVSIARNGTQATIALDARNLWQLTVRGAVLKAPLHGNQWLAKATGTRVDWALKRLSRNTTRQGKHELPELPFELEIPTRTR